MIKIEPIINSRIASDAAASELIKRFSSPTSDRCRFCLGRTEYSAAVAKSFDIEAFIDDFSDPGTVYLDKPVIRCADIPHHALIINCVIIARPITAHKRLEDCGACVITYMDLYTAFPDLLPMPKYVLQTRNDLKENLSHWEHLYSSISEEASKKVLDDILRFRLSGDYRSMKDYSVRLKEQYFEDFLGLSSQDVFVDCGGFDGDTTELFCQYYPRYKKVFLFEPSQSNIQKAVARLNKFHSIEFIEKGVSDSEGILRFDSDSGSASAVCESGSTQIQVTTLDLAIRERVSFIKMDLEGWELKALKGAKQHIINDHPRLAIATYHEPSHFWQVYEFVNTLRHDYKIFLRHYTEGWTETIMYFIPESNRFI